jgi:5-methylcytosine-specific restriction endonuclease McrA
VPHVSREVRRYVEQRAEERCEYCHAPQLVANSPFHVEHIIPLNHGGTDDVANLALGCGACNLAKGTRISALDPTGGETIPLFHPRHHLWEEHFFWSEDRVTLVGRTAIGTATIAALNMNGFRQTRARPFWRRLGLFP